MQSPRDRHGAGRLHKDALLIGHIAYLATRIEGLVSLVTEKAYDWKGDVLDMASRAVRALGTSIASSRNDGGSTLAALRQSHRTPPTSNLLGAASRGRSAADRQGNRRRRCADRDEQNACPRVGHARSRAPSEDDRRLARHNRFWRRSRHLAGSMEFS